MAKMNQKMRNTNKLKKTNKAKSCKNDNLTVRITTQEKRRNYIFKYNPTQRPAFSVMIICIIINKNYFLIMNGCSCLFLAEAARECIVPAK